MWFSLATKRRMLMTKWKPQRLANLPNLTKIKGTRMPRAALKVIVMKKKSRAMVMASVSSVPNSDRLICFK
jgi:hypothetical protein